MIRECKNCGPVPLSGWYRVPGRGLRCRVCAWAAIRRSKMRGKTPESRACLTCGKTKPASEFHRLGKGSPRLRAHCKPCYRSSVNEKRAAARAAGVAK